MSAAPLPFYANGSETLLSLSPQPAVRARSRLPAPRVSTSCTCTTRSARCCRIMAIMRSPRAGDRRHVPQRRPERLSARCASSRPLLRRVFRRLDALDRVSEAVVDSLQPFFPARRFTTIPNGIDTDFFSPDAEPLPSSRRQADDRLRRPVRPAQRRQAHDRRVHRAARDARRRPARDRRRRSAAPARRADGPGRRCATTCVFAGRVNQLRPRYLAGAEILCTPCSLASFGMVLLEGMSAGLPVVASRLAGLRARDARRHRRR